MLSPEDMQKIYREIHKKLTEPFPEGTLEAQERDPNSKYIPVQPYIHRLEEAAGVHWSWHLTGPPVIYETEDLVQVTGVLKILDAEREGVGFSNLQRYSDTKKIRNLKEAIRSAGSDALRDAADKFEMGWKDLAPFRKWAKNPGAGLVSATQRSSREEKTQQCMRCKVPLNQEDIRMLEELSITMLYCQEHIPAHLIRNARK
ncbi:hypothetical protein [Ammoniphilus resinae]|uniref:Uncharacterized protein n=1 Tax=Ammoniphilus resinae TaxID=861532 RepID=A0ABS4GNW8_9BACL|nr:hypothetical protein [Ammoniphilus resinae]MBP1931965.1 hypothetical protein [Ammoniphilus resinae]